MIKILTKDDLDDDFLIQDNKVKIPQYSARLIADTSDREYRSKTDNPNGCVEFSTDLLRMYGRTFMNASSEDIYQRAFHMYRNLTFWISKGCPELDGVNSDTNEYGLNIETFARALNDYYEQTTGTDFWSEEEESVETKLENLKQYVSIENLGPYSSIGNYLATLDSTINELNYKIQALEDKVAYLESER